MSEIGEYFQDWKEYYRDVRENCKEMRLEFLKKSDLDYQILNLSAGHVRISTIKAKYDIWLGSGKWAQVGTNKFSQGWGELLKRIDRDNAQSGYCEG